MDRPLMECGHSANATDGNGNPVCVICFSRPGDSSTRVAQRPPDLSGRQAVCDECHKSTRPSSSDLPFFQYRGLGSPWATRYCKCGYSLITYKGERHVCSRPDGGGPRGPAETDSYYCGCRGWN